MHDLSDVRAGHTCGRIITRHHLSSSTKMAYAKYDFLPRDADFFTASTAKQRPRQVTGRGPHIYIYMYIYMHVIIYIFTNFYTCTGSLPVG